MVGLDLRDLFYPKQLSDSVMILLQACPLQTALWLTPTHFSAGSGAAGHHLVFLLWDHPFKMRWVEWERGCFLPNLGMALSWCHGSHTVAWSWKCSSWQSEGTRRKGDFIRVHIARESPVSPGWLISCHSEDDPLFFTVTWSVAGEMNCCSCSSFCNKLVLSCRLP